MVDLVYAGSLYLDIFGAGQTVYKSGCHAKVFGRVSVMAFVVSGKVPEQIRILVGRPVNEKVKGAADPNSVQMKISARQEDKYDVKGALG